MPPNFVESFIKDIKKSPLKQYFIPPIGEYYFRFDNNINHTKCVIKFYTGFKNNPVIKMVIWGISAMASEPIMVLGILSKDMVIPI